MRRTFWFKIITITVAVAAFFIILNFTPLKEKTKNFFYSISFSLQRNLWEAGDSFSDFVESIFQNKKIKEENQELKVRIQQLTSENISLQKLKEENEVLRKALDVGLEKEFRLSFAKVVAKDVFQDSILVNKGKKDSVSLNSPVITEQKTLIGKIGEVHENFSKVILISNSNISFDVELANREISGLAKGKGNLNLILELLPWEEEIEEGEQVITTSLGGVFPEGILVGEVKNVKKSDINPFQTAEIKPATDFKELENLFIVTEF